MQAIICYCDWTDLCTSFSSSFRAICFEESIGSIKRRHSAYYHLSVLLLESVQIYGHGGVMTTYIADPAFGRVPISGSVRETGPFFCGISAVMPVPEFQIKLMGPTSTSVHQEVALRFADQDGMILTFNNDGTADNYGINFLDTKWISRYWEEDERYYL